MKLRSALVLVAFLAISFAVAGLGSLATLTNVDGWYADAAKVSWNPPNWIFGPVWTLLYTLMSVSAWVVWRGGAWNDRASDRATPAPREPATEVSERKRVNVRPALAAYVVQLVLNAVWTPVFFGLYPFAGASALWIGLVIIVALDVAVLVTMIRFWRVRRAAAWMLVPYWAWVLFATTLNAGLAVLNS